MDPDPEYPDLGYKNPVIPLVTNEDWNDFKDPDDPDYLSSDMYPEVRICIRIT